MLDSKENIEVQVLLKVIHGFLPLEKSLDYSEPHFLHHPKNIIKYRKQYGKLCHMVSSVNFLI